MATGACIPPGMVEFVAVVGRMEAVDHLAVRRTLGVHVDGGEVVMLLVDPPVWLDAGDVQELLSWGGSDCV